MKLSLFQGSREIQILADSTAGFPAAASHCAWSPSSGLLPGEDYQLRLEIVDDRGQVGTAQVDFALQRPAAVVAENQGPPSTVPKSAHNEAIFQETQETVPPDSPPPLPADASDPGKPPRDPSTRISELPLPSLPLGPRIVFLCSTSFALFIGLGGTLHYVFRDGFALAKEISPPNPKLLGTDYSKILHPDKVDKPFPPPLLPQPGEGAQEAIRQAEESKPDTTDIGGSINRISTRVPLLLDRASYGFVSAGLCGLGIGAAIGTLWWISLGIAAWGLRRPLEIVFDDWGLYFELPLGLGAIIPALFVLAGGLNVWSLVIGTVFGLFWGGALAALNLRTNERRQDIILGNEA